MNLSAFCIVMQPPKWKYSLFQMEFRHYSIFEPFLCFLCTVISNTDINFHLHVSVAYGNMEKISGNLFHSLHVHVIICVLFFFFFFLWLCIFYSLAYFQTMFIESNIKEADRVTAKHPCSAKIKVNALLVSMAFYALQNIENYKNNCFLLWSFFCCSCHGREWRYLDHDQVSAMNITQRQNRMRQYLIKMYFWRSASL